MSKSYEGSGGSGSSRGRRVWTFRILIASLSPWLHSTTLHMLPPSPLPPIHLHLMDLIDIIWTNRSHGASQQAGVPPILDPWEL